MRTAGRIFSFKRKAVAGIILLLLVESGQNSSAQKGSDFNFQFRHLSVEEGLSQSNVNCILQDRLGYLWMGTSDGLNKYDGYIFSYYKHDPADSNSISAPYVLSLFENDDGKLWIGTEGGGLNIFDPATERFKIFKNNPQNKLSISSNRVSGVCHDEGDYYWVSTFGGGLNRFNLKTGVFEHIVNDSSRFSLSNYIIKMIKGSDGLLYLATRGGLIVSDYKNHRVTHYKHDDADSNSLADNRLQSVYEDRQGNTWICTFNSGVYKIDRQSKRLTQYAHGKSNSNSIGADFINCIYEDSQGLFWIGTFENGISLYNPGTNSFSEVSNDQDDKFSLNNNHIQCFFEDRQGLIWIGTNGGGLNIYHKRFGNFSSLNNIWKNDKTPDHNNVYSVTEDDNKKIWIGTNGAGLYSYDRNSGVLNNYSHNENDKQSISGNSTWSLLKISPDKIFAGSHGQGISVVNGKTGRCINYRKDSANNNSLSSDMILCMSRIDQNTVWIGTLRTGINILKLKNNIFTHYQQDENDSESLSSNSVYTIYKARNGTVYIGTQRGGLNIFDNKKKSFRHFINNPADLFSVSSNDVQCITEDNKGMIWIGTNGGGLNAFDSRTNRFTRFTEKQGLPNNVIYGICKDEHDNLWLSTNRGICRFTPPAFINFENKGSVTNSEFHVRNFDVSDGITANEFNQGAYYQNEKGWIYFGNINGLTCFHPDSVDENTYKPTVTLSRFKVFEKDYLPDTLITYKKKITLSYDQNFFSFEFAALNYLLPEKNNYAVMMENFDHNWIFTGNRRYASYTNLNPGDYIFKVKAANNDGIWNDQFASVYITVTPPFWMTWWFKVLVAVALAAIVGVVFQLRINRIRKQEAQKTAFNKSLAEVEMKALRAQMNPHFIFNSLHSINKYVMDNDRQNASSYLADFSKLMRLILENSREQEVPLERDLSALELYMQLESLRFQNKFNYSIEIDPLLDKETTLIPPLLLQPFVENSILHGIRNKENGLIKIKIAKVENMICCSVEDNGKGRSQTVVIESGEKMKRESLGMKITVERLNIINQQKKSHAEINIIDLTDDGNKPAGLRIELLLPFEQAF